MLRVWNKKTPEGIGKQGLVTRNSKPSEESGYFSQAQSKSTDRMAQENLQRFPDQVQNPERETEIKTSGHF